MFYTFGETSLTNSEIHVLMEMWVELINIGTKYEVKFWYMEIHVMLVIECSCKTFSFKFLLSFFLSDVLWVSLKSTWHIGKCSVHVSLGFEIEKGTLYIQLQKMIIHSITRNMNINAHYSSKNISLVHEYLWCISLCRIHKIWLPDGNVIECLPSRNFNKVTVAWVKFHSLV